VATRDQVRDLAGEGLDYPEIGRRLGIAAGQAYLIGTGMPADGGDTYTVTERQRPHVLPSAQHLIGPPVENPHDPGSGNCIGSRCGYTPTGRCAAPRSFRAAHPAGRDRDHECASLGRIVASGSAADRW
jgi:hypothetical protein